MSSIAALDRRRSTMSSTTGTTSSNASTIIANPADHINASGRQSQILQQPTTGLRLPSNRKTIYDRNLNRTRNADLSRASFAYLFGEMVVYAQRRVTGIQDLERRYMIIFSFALLSHT